MAPFIAPEWLQIEREMGSRPLLSGSLENYQKNAKLIEQYIVEHLPPHEDDGLVTEDRKINDHVTVRIYGPSQKGIPLPVGVFCHEGGFCEGSVETGDPLCRIVASRCPCIVVSVEYRKVPTVEIETVFQDALDAFTWTYEQSLSLGGDPEKVFMFGCSAGGSLSLGTAHKLIELGRRSELKAVINLAGGTVHAKNIPARIQHLYVSMEENAEGVPIIDRQATNIINAVAGLDEKMKDPWIFPVLSEHLAEFPPTYLVACGADPLRDDNVILASELESKNVKVRLDLYPGLPHLFWVFPTLKSSRLFIEKLLAGIKFVLE